MSCNVTLREVVEFQKGFAFKSKDYKDNGVRIVKVSNLTSDSIDISQCVCIDEELAIKYSDKYNLIYDDIIITTVGSWPTNPASVVGKVVKVPKNASHTLLNQNAVRLRSNDNLHQRYLYYMLKNNNFREYIVGTAQGSANQASITQEDIKNYEFNLPSLEEQEKIANILSSLDDKIELNNEMNKTLEEMAQALFKRWFVDFEFPSVDGKPYKSSGGEMVESELGMIPKGWEVKELSELVEIKTKSEKPFDNEDILYEHYSIPALDDGRLPILEYGKNISSNKYKIDNECILISKLNPSNKRIWNPYCITSKAICSTEFIVYKAIHNYPKSFIYEIINSDRFTEFLVSNATGSTGSRQRVKPKETLGLKIAIPCMEKIKDISYILEPIHQKVQINIQNIKYLTEIRDTLLPKLMSGEVRVK